MHETHTLSSSPGQGWNPNAQVKAERPPSIVLEASNKLSDMQDHTNDLILLLEKRLQIALTPPGPSPVRDKADGQDMSSELHERMVGAVRRQVQLNHALQELIDRIVL